MSAQSCAHCDADFSPGSAWRPIAKPATRTARTQWPKEEDQSERSKLWARVVATAGLLYGLFTVGSFLAIFTTLSLPIGIRNSPVQGWLALAVVYIVLVFYGLYECWTKPPYTRLVLALAAVPVLLTVLGPLIGLLWAVR